jgi:hypothetical protein
VLVEPGSYSPRFAIGSLKPQGFINATAGPYCDVTGVATWPMGARAQQPPAIDPQGAANLKLPLWDMICLSYSTYFYNFRTYCAYPGYG